jgi:ribonuclease P/MRP protein subunit POP5
MRIPKHLRPRWRYLVVAVETWPDTPLNRRDLQAAVWSAGRSLLGDPGSADADLKVIRFRFSADAGAGQAVVRVRHGHADAARAAIACVDSVEGHPVGLSVEATGGTVRSCEEKYLREPPEAERKDVVFGDTDHLAVVRDGVADLRDGDTFTGATVLDLE